MPAAYRCSNIGNCQKADRKEMIDLAEGVDPVCPECGAQLTPAKPPEKPVHTVSCVVVSVLLLLLGAFSFYGIKSLLGPQTPSVPLASPAPAQTTPLVAETLTPATSLATTTPAPTTPLIAATPAPTTSLAGETPIATVVLRIHGSNTIGSKLVPALIDEFLKQQGATGMHIVTGKTVDESEVEATFPGESSPKRVEIFAHGSATAFADLQTDKCDIGMASRQIKADEAKSCGIAGLGDMYSPASEHVLGLDGIAVIVNHANPLNALTKNQVADIFSGQVSDWSQVGGTAGHINLYARDANSARSALDNKALRDLDRMADLLSNEPYHGKYLLLLGFADGTGDASKNLALSKDRAHAVAVQLESRGIKPAVVTGFGKELPVASNETQEGREKNRRVEVWLRDWQR
jgi:phosphate transport system substrate-binding protein